VSDNDSGTNRLKEIRGGRRVTGRDQEAYDRLEMAHKAVTIANRMTPGLNSFARGLTGNSRAHVVFHQGDSYVDTGVGCQPSLALTWTPVGTTCRRC
jgi:hypothetical protein